MQDGVGKFSKNTTSEYQILVQVFIHIELSN